MIENSKTTRPVASWSQLFLAFGNPMKPLHSFLGSYALHTDPIVRGRSCQCVSVYVCHFEDEMSRDRSPGE